MSLRKEGLGVGLAQRGSGEGNGGTRVEEIAGSSGDWGAPQASYGCEPEVLAVRSLKAPYV